MLTKRFRAIVVLTLLLVSAASAYPVEEQADPRILRLEEAISRLDQESHTILLNLEVEQKPAKRSGLKSRLEKQKKQKRRLQHLLQQAKQDPASANWTEIETALSQARR